MVYADRHPAVAKAAVLVPGRAPLIIQEHGRMGRSTVGHGRPEDVLLLRALVVRCLDYGRQVRRKRYRGPRDAPIRLPARIEHQTASHLSAGWYSPPSRIR